MRPGDWLQAITGMFSYTRYIRRENLIFQVQNALKNAGMFTLCHLPGLRWLPVNKGSMAKMQKQCQTLARLLGVKRRFSASYTLRWLNLDRFSDVVGSIMICRVLALIVVDETHVDPISLSLFRLTRLGCL